MICGSGRSKSRLAKAGGAEPPGEMREEKLHAVVTRSTFRSKKHTNVGTLLEDEMFKKCTALWREAHFEVKIYKTHHSQRHQYYYHCCCYCYCYCYNYNYNYTHTALHYVTHRYTTLFTLHYATTTTATATTTTTTLQYTTLR